MKITVNTAGQFRTAFHQAGRKDQFSYDALGLLFDYLEENDPDYELDVVELCCYYAELSENEIRASYNVSSERDIEDFLQENTAYVGKTETGFVFAPF